MISDSDLIFEMQQVFAAMARQNTSIYSVDPRGLAVFQYGVGKGSRSRRTPPPCARRRIRCRTWRPIPTAARSSIAMNCRRHEANHSRFELYYLLGFSSAQAPTDGKFHQIKVNVKRKGIEVRGRKGYSAYTVDDVARANAPRKEDTVPTAISTALNVLAAPARDRWAHF